MDATVKIVDIINRMVDVMNGILDDNIVNHTYILLLRGNPLQFKEVIEFNNL